MRAVSISRGLVAVAVIALLATPVAAAEDARDTLRTLYRIALSADMCGFPMQKRQAEVLGKAIDKALSESGLDEDKAEELYRSIDTGLEAEGWEKVCAQKGDWARDYRAILAARTE